MCRPGGMHSLTSLKSRSLELRFPALWASKYALLILTTKQDFFDELLIFDAKRCILNTFLSVTLDIHFGSKIEVLS